MFTVTVPATTANLGPGFDTLGMALQLFLQVEVETANETIVEFYGQGRGEVLQNPGDNLIIAAMQEVFYRAGTKMPAIRLIINNPIPVGKGLGSSAAAIVAGMFAANCMLNDQFSADELLQWAVIMEGHADNVVPAVAGGLTTVMQNEGTVYFQKVEVPEELKTIVVVPDFILPTAKSRAVLPDKIDLKDTVTNLQRACFLLAAVANRDFGHLGLSMNDAIYQPARKQFIPGFDQVVKQAKKMGAMGVALSGAGPSIVALVRDREDLIGEAMQHAFARYGVKSQLLHLKPSNQGVVCR